MNPKQIQTHNCNITGNRLGDNVTINQGDVYHYHSTSVPPRPRTPIRLIPYLQNKEFVDRPGLVDKLNVLLQQDSECFNDAALWGLGGSGKTQIALEYAYRQCKNPQCSIFWVHADTKASFIHDYKKIAALFGLEGILDGQELELLRAVSNRIQSQPQWLLVLDNADDLSLFGVGETQEGSSNLLDLVPKGTAMRTIGTVLWTSRDGQIAGSLVRPSRRAIQVSYMTSMEAKKLLAIARGENFDNGHHHHHHEKDEDKDVEKLLEDLQWLPLGISQAGAYIRRAEVTVRQYLALLSNIGERWSLLEEEQFDLYREHGVPNSILKIWSISIARIEQENFLASELLRVMAYFDNRYIPYDMIDAAARYVSTTKLTSVEVKRAIIRLKEFSFIRLRVGESGSQNYEMHKLVQEATQYALSVTQQTDRGNDSRLCSARVAVQVVDSLFPNPFKEYAMNRGKEGGNKIYPDLLERSQKYLAHAVKVADWAEISKQEKTICGLLSRVSAYLRYKSRWKDMRLVNVRILKLRSSLFGTDQVGTVLSEHSIAANYYSQKLYPEALEVEKRLLKNLQRSLGEQNLYTLYSMHHVADIMCKLLQFKQAEQLQAHAIGLLENEVGQSARVLMVESLYCLARAYYGQEKFYKVGQVCAKSLKYCRDNFGGPRCHWYVLAAIRTIQFRGRTLIVQGALQSRATAIMESMALYICEGIQRHAHFHEVARMEMLVRVNAAVGKGLEVVDMQVEVAEFYCKIFGENHHKTIVAIEYLTVLFYSLCRYGEVETPRAKIFKFMRGTAWEEHPSTLGNMISPVLIDRGQDHFDELGYIEKKMLPVYSKMLGRPFSLHFIRFDDVYAMALSLVEVDDDVHNMSMECIECLYRQNYFLLLSTTRSDTVVTQLMKFLSPYAAVFIIDQLTELIGSEQLTSTIGGFQLSVFFSGFLFSLLLSYCISFLISYSSF